jgi:hypothetical protein
MYSNTHSTFFSNKINAWIESTAQKKPVDKDGINIPATNGYQRRLVYQEVRNK